MACDDWEEKKVPMARGTGEKEAAMAAGLRVGMRKGRRSKGEGE
jgi:hypothetical protein